MKASASTLDLVVLIADVQVLNSIIAALMDEMTMMRKAMTSLVKDDATLESKRNY